MSSRVANQLSIRSNASGREQSVAAVQMGFAGHRLMFIRRLVVGLQGGTLILYTVSGCRESREFGLHLGDLQAAGRVQVEVVGSIEEGTRVLLGRALKKAAHLGIHHIVIPDADPLISVLCWHAATRLGSRLPRLTVVLMRTSVPLGRWSRHAVACLVKRMLVRALPLVWPGAKGFFLTDAFGVMQRRRGYPNLAPVPNPPPDYCETGREDTRMQLKVQPDTFLLGLVGMVNSYKHPELAFGAMLALPSNIKLLIAGPMDAVSADLLDEATAHIGSDRVVRVAGYLSETELGRYIAACDAVLQTYQNDDPSATLISAVRARVPVIAAGSPWLKAIVGNLRLGVVTDMSVPGVVRAIQGIAQGRETFMDPLGAAKERIIDAEVFERTLLGKSRSCQDSGLSRLWQTRCKWCQQRVL